MKEKIRSTTVICVRRDGKVVMAGDGQVTLGHEVLKSSAKKLRRLYNDKMLAGFAGSTADAFSLFTRFESKLEQFNGNLPRSVVELAKEWRTDRVLRHLEALLLVADAGEHVHRERQRRRGRAGRRRGRDRLRRAVCRIGGDRAAAQHEDCRRAPIAEQAMQIAGKICIYTNDTCHFRGARLVWSSIFPVSRWTKSRCSTSSRRAKSCASWTSTWSGRRTPSARWRSRCATASGARSCRRRWPKR